MINEHFIQFIWQHKLFDVHALKTVQDEQVKLVNTGVLNEYDGPDFSGAHLFIGDLEWFGSVEIHLQDIDWQKHGHQDDKRYESVILHVVWEVKSTEAIPKDIPCLILKDFVNENVMQKYASLMQNNKSLACANDLGQIKLLDKDYALSSHAFNRLHRKSEALFLRLESTHYDWKQILFYLFAIALGKKVNKEAMTHLAESINVKLLSKHKGEEDSVAAMLFGVAGLLADSEDAYDQNLQAEFLFLKEKYSLDTLSDLEWKYSKVRGASRPYLSVALLISIVHQIDDLEAVESIDEAFLTGLKFPEYWQKHHEFGKLSKTQNSVTKELVDHLKINVLVPYLMLFYRFYNDDSYLYKAQSVLESLKPEKNSIITKLTGLGFEIKDGFLSQGSIEMYNEYCLKKRCLECHVGKNILGRR